MPRFPVRCLFLMTVVYFLIAREQPIRAQEKTEPQKTCSLTVLHDNTALPELVLVELHQDGKVIRTRELKIREFGVTATDERVTWTKLPPGRYELHFEGKGYEKFIKRITLVEDDETPKYRAELDKKAVVIGDGVSLAEMQKQLEALKKKVAELEAEVEKLKKK
jgi:hypothetical protein